MKKRVGFRSEVNSDYFLQLFRQNQTHFFLGTHKVLFKKISNCSAPQNLNEMNGLISEICRW